MGKIIKNGVELSGSSNSAENIKYDDTKNVKEAIDETSENLNKKVPFKNIVTGSADDLINPGIYSGIELTNAPSQNWCSFIITNQAGNTSYVHQLAYVISEQSPYVRVRQNGTWTSWDKLVSSSDLSKIGTIYHVQLGSTSETISTSPKTYTAKLGNEAGRYIVFCNVVSESHYIFNAELSISGLGTYRSYKGGASSISGYPICAGYIEENADVSLMVQSASEYTNHFTVDIFAVRLI